MQSEITPITLLDLKDLIYTQILTISPDATLADAITLMSQVRTTCSLFNSRKISVEDFDLSVQQRKIAADKINISTELLASCILVVEGTSLVGIFTVQDLVRLQAEKVKLEQTKIVEVVKPLTVTLTLSEECNIFQLLSLFRQYQISYLPVLDGQEQLIGIITPESILRGLPPLDLFKSKPVSAVMTNPVPQTSAESSITDVFQFLLTHQCSYVVLTQKDINQDLLPSGLITEQDLIQFSQLSLWGLDLSKTQAQMLLRSPQFCLSSQDSLSKAQQQMLDLDQVEALLVCTSRESEATPTAHFGILTAANLLPELELALYASLTPREMLSVVETLQKTIKKQEKLLKQVKGQLEKQQLQGQKTEKVLRESEDKLKSLLTNIPGAIYRGICNDRWMMEFISDGITEISGYCSSDFTHNQTRKFESIIHPQDLKMVEREIQNAIIERRPYEIEYRVIRVDGNLRWVREVGRSTFSQDGDVIWLNGAIFDITKRKKEEAELHGRHD